jgi:hypothetical protein
VTSAALDLPRKSREDNFNAVDAASAGLEFALFSLPYAGKIATGITCIAAPSLAVDIPA